MRHAACALVLLAITACSSEPDFDDHYDTLSQDIEERAAMIEKDLAEPQKANGPVKSDGEKQD